MPRGSPHSRPPPGHDPGRPPPDLTKQGPPRSRHTTGPHRAPSCPREAPRHAGPAHRLEPRRYERSPHVYRLRNNCSHRDHRACRPVHAQALNQLTGVAVILILTRGAAGLLLPRLAKRPTERLRRWARPLLARARRSGASRRIVCRAPVSDPTNPKSSGELRGLHDEPQSLHALGLVPALGVRGNWRDLDPRPW